MPDTTLKTPEATKVAPKTETPTPTPAVLPHGDYAQPRQADAVTAGPVKPIADTVTDETGKKAYDPKAQDPKGVEGIRQEIMDFIHKVFHKHGLTAPVELGNTVAMVAHNAAQGHYKVQGDQPKDSSIASRAEAGRP